MTVDRQANARVIGQLEAQVAELETSLQGKRTRRLLNMGLALLGAMAIVFSMIAMFVAAPLFFCWGFLALGGFVMAAVGVGGALDSNQGDAESQLIRARSRLAEFRALTVG
jgi:hypothetical protein